MTTTQNYSAQPRTYTYQQSSLQPVTHTYHSSQVPRALEYSYETSPSGRSSQVSAGSHLTRAYTTAPATRTSYVTGTGERAYEQSFDRSTSLQALPGAHGWSTSHQALPVTRSYVTNERVLDRSSGSLYNFQTNAPVITVATNRGQNRPFVGLGMRTNAKDNSRGLQCDVLWSDGPAQRAGVRLEDEIIAIGNNGQRLTSLRQAQSIIEREARVGGYLRVVGRHAQTGYRYETQVRVMTRDAGTGSDYFDTTNKRQDTLEKPLSRKNSIYNPNATRLSDGLSESVVHGNTSPRASEAALGRRSSMLEF